MSEQRPGQDLADVGRLVPGIFPAPTLPPELAVPELFCPHTQPGPDEALDLAARPAPNSHTNSLPRNSPKERRRKKARIGEEEMETGRGCGRRTPHSQDIKATSQQSEQ